MIVYNVNIITHEERTWLPRHASSISMISRSITPELLALVLSWRRRQRRREDQRNNETPPQLPVKSRISTLYLKASLLSHLLGECRSARELWTANGGKFIRDSRKRYVTTPPPPPPPPPEKPRNYIVRCAYRNPQDASTHECTRASNPWWPCSSISRINKHRKRLRVNKFEGKEETEKENKWRM